MNKQQAIEKWVDQEMSGIPQDWVAKVAEATDGEYLTLPMWGTMFIVSEFDGEKFMKNSRRMVYSAEDIDLDEIEEKEGKERRKEIEKAIEAEEYSIYEDYIDEEMDGAYCILDKDGSPTAAYIYEIDGKYIVGIDGAGWNFFDGVWDKLYDVAGLHWHKEE
jgi:hypothetical protein